MECRFARSRPLGARQMERLYSFFVWVESLSLLVHVWDLLPVDLHSIYV